VAQRGRDARGRTGKKRGSENTSYFVVGDSDFGEEVGETYFAEGLSEAEWRGIAAAVGLEEKELTFGQVRRLLQRMQQEGGPPAEKTTREEPKRPAPAPAMPTEPAEPAAELAAEPAPQPPTPSVPEPPVTNGIPCPQCKRDMRPRQNRSNSGWFFGCGDYPNCKATRTYREGQAMAAARRPEGP